MSARSLEATPEQGTVVLDGQDLAVPALQYSDGITARNRKEVKLQGYMMPLELGEKQKRFLLSANAPTCAYCLPGGPDSLVEVLAKKPIRYGVEPILVSGTLTVLKSDPTGLFYRLSDAVLVAR